MGIINWLKLSMPWRDKIRNKSRAKGYDVDEKGNYVLLPEMVVKRLAEQERRLKELELKYGKK